MHHKSQISFNGVRIDCLSFNKILDKIYDNRNHKGYICLVEASGVIRQKKDKELSAAYASSLINIPDGTPLAWFGKLSGSKEIQRLSGPDLLSKIFELELPYTHFLLGDTDSTIIKVIKKAKRINPRIKISGYSPPFKQSFDEADNDLILQKIENAKADLVWVSFGLGKQEKWIFQNYQKISSGIMIGVGAAFRFYTGEIATPPVIIQKFGLQWYTRLLQRPKCWLKLGFIERVHFVPVFFQELIKVNKGNN